MCSPFAVNDSSSEKISSHRAWRVGSRRRCKSRRDVRGTSPVNGGKSIQLLQGLEASGRSSGMAAGVVGARRHRGALEKMEVALTPAAAAGTSSSIVAHPVGAHRAPGGGGARTPSSAKHSLAVSRIHLLFTAAAASACLARRVHGAAQENSPPGLLLPPGIARATAPPRRYTPGTAGRRSPPLRFPPPATACLDRRIHGAA